MTDHPVPADPPSPRYIVDRETLIAAYQSQAWSSPDQMADMLLDGLATLDAARAPDAGLRDHEWCVPHDHVASSPAPAGLDVEAMLRAWVGCVQRLIETAPINSIVEETGITKRNHSTPPERRAIRDEALAVVDRWFIRDLLRLAVLRAATRPAEDEQ